MAMEFYLKERHNPQFKEPYYIKCGKMSKRDAKKGENPIYGFNIMRPYKTEQEYLEAIKYYESKGFSVHS